MPVDKNSHAYIDGWNAEAIRQVRKNASRAALDAHPNLADITSEVEKRLGQKNRIFAQSPHLASALDADDIAKMSAGELASYELKQLGIDVPPNSDPVEAHAMFHAGRLHGMKSYGQQVPGNRLAGGNNVAIPGNRLLGGMDSNFQSIVDKYLQE